MKRCPLSFIVKLRRNILVCNLYSERCSYKILEERIYFDCNFWEEIKRIVVMKFSNIANWGSDNKQISFLDFYRKYYPVTTFK